MSDVTVNRNAEQFYQELDNLQRIFARNLGIIQDNNVVAVDQHNLNHAGNMDALINHKESIVHNFEPIDTFMGVEHPSAEVYPRYNFENALKNSVGVLTAPLLSYRGKANAPHHLGFAARMADMAAQLPRTSDHTSEAFTQSAASHNWVANHDANALYNPRVHRPQADIHKPAPKRETWGVPVPISYGTGAYIPRSVVQTPWYAGMEEGYFAEKREQELRNYVLKTNPLSGGLPRMMNM